MAHQRPARSVSSEGATAKPFRGAPGRVALLLAQVPHDQSDLSPGGLTVDREPAQVDAGQKPCILRPGDVLAVGDIGGGSTPCEPAGSVGTATGLKRSAARTTIVKSWARVIST